MNRLQEKNMYYFRRRTCLSLGYKTWCSVGLRVLLSLSLKIIADFIRVRDFSQTLIRILF